MRNTVILRSELEKLAIEEALEESVGEPWEQKIAQLENRMRAKRRLDNMLLPDRYYIEEKKRA